MKRARIFGRTRTAGYIDDYGGIRVLQDRQALPKIEKAVIWNTSDVNGRYYGQAATFDTWHYLASATSVTPQTCSCVLIFTFKYH